MNKFWKFLNNLIYTNLRGMVYNLIAPNPKRKKCAKISECFSSSWLWALLLALFQKDVMPIFLRNDFEKMWSVHCFSTFTVDLQICVKLIISFKVLVLKIIMRWFPHRMSRHSKNSFLNALLYLWLYAAQLHPNSFIRVQEGSNWTLKFGLCHKVQTAFDDCRD